jgi:hypothetical protein
MFDEKARHRRQHRVRPIAVRRMPASGEFEPPRAGESNASSLQRSSYSISSTRRRTVSPPHRHQENKLTTVPQAAQAARTRPWMRFDVHPGIFRPWQLAFEGEIATVVMRVAEDAIAERTSFSPDAWAGLEQKLRFGGVKPAR